MPSDAPAPPLIHVDHDGASGVATSSRVGWEIELQAGSGRLDVATASDLIRRLVVAVDQADAGATVRWRVPEPTTEHTTIARAAGFESRRALWQMRRALPAPAPSPLLPTRPFQPGLDDAEWLRVNNLAFSWHPEQGGWTSTELEARLQEPWVDLAGFLLHPGGPDDSPGSAIDGFCWTKVHADLDPTVGEIFVIAVDPAATGSGLGRRLVLAGLAWLHAQGCPQAMLYTEADNEAAVALYRSLDFTVHHEVRVFERATTTQTPTPTTAPSP